MKPLNSEERSGAYRSFFILYLLSLVMVAVVILVYNPIFGAARKDNQQATLSDKDAEINRLTAETKQLQSYFRLVANTAPSLIEKNPSLVEKLHKDLDQIILDNPGLKDLYPGIETAKDLIPLGLAPMKECDCDREVEKAVRETEKDYEREIKSLERELAKCN